MPNRDGTGPAGRGPKTGRGLGPCRRASTIQRKRRRSNIPYGRRRSRGKRDR